MHSHADPHKYRCPRCFTLTCSLRCATLHKRRAPCNGVRDPTKYLPRSALATAKGIDRDYNYLTSLERALDSADRDAAHRGIVLSSHDTDGVSTTRPQSLQKGEAPLQVALERSGVIISRAPKGMTRDKSNNTHWHKKRRCIVWTVEWILADGTVAIKECAEDRPISEVYSSTFAPPAKEPETNRAKKRRRKMQKRELESAGSGPPVEAVTEAFDNDKDDEGATRPETKQTDQSTQPDFAFYLHSPSLPNKNKVLSPLAPDATLSASLRNRLILEFPTIYIFERRRKPSQDASATDPNTSGREAKQNTAAMESEGLEVERIGKDSAQWDDIDLPDGFITEKAFYALATKVKHPPPIETRGNRPTIEEVPAGES